VGRNPLAGIAAAFAGVAAGFGVNFLITPLDGVLTEITNDASALVDPNAEIDLAANLYFGIISAIFVTVVLTFVTARLVEGRIGPYDPADAGDQPEEIEVEDSEGEARGLRYALWATLGVIVVIGLLTVIPGAPLQDPETGRVIGDSPFMDSLILIISLIFFAAGLAYGRGAGTITTKAGVLSSITKSWAGLASLLFLFLLIAQFIAYFNFSNMAQVAAVQLGDLLERADIGAIWLLIGFIIVTMVVDLVMPAAIAKWAILAPIFIPLLIRLNVTPQTVLAAYRVGDSPLNVVTPLMAYFPLIVVFVQRYQKSAGIGTVVALMIPYVIILSVSWIALFVAWYLIGIPWGPGSPVHP
jgi:aminobenzoyl-glutamate transport protein